MDMVQTPNKIYESNKGEKIGSGVIRDVYEYGKGYVLKFDKYSGSENFYEYQNYQIAKERGWDEWLAPCVSISDDHKYLIQKRGMKVMSVPEDLPEWIKKIDDKAARQWVRINGRAVLCDYGGVDLNENPKGQYIEKKNKQ